MPVSAASQITRIPENWPKWIRQALALFDKKADVAGDTFTGPVAVPVGGSAATENAGGVSSLQTTSTGNGADTTEDVLQTYNLPANTFGASGAKLVRITATGHTAANADNKTVRLYFGSEVIATPTAATNNKGWWLQLEVTRTGASTQRVTGCGQVDTTSVTPLSATGAETETAAITIKCTGQAGTGNANDILCDQMIVEVLN